ncbi:MAG: right-handed parallel beta-helix repeat-containing protein, partial [Candidatus Hydrogenedentes bacterium]|nr:right-handed parallel beta-helix repeat-containing protein [Candidatus Hydrogenedentota bacterium]
RGGGTLYLCSTVNPGKAYAGIECVLWGQRKLVSARRHVVLEDLSFLNSGVHGFQETDVRHVAIRGCEFRFIGGAVWNRERRMRFGNAVELWDGASEVTVEGCLFDNIYDSAVTHQGGETKHIPERIHFRNNLFTDCGLAAYESREPSQEIYFEYNTCINGGGGFSMQGENPPRATDPYPQPVGYHVWAWMIEPRRQPGKVYIRHNIFCESTGPAVCMSIDAADAEKFILDDNCYWKSTPGKLIEWSGEKPYSQEEFARYQSECANDPHSRIAKPLFEDESRGDLRQRKDSPCFDAGMQIDGEGIRL